MRCYEVILLFFSLLILSHRGGAVAAEGYIYKKEESISSVFQGGDTSGWASCHYLNGKCDALYDGVNWYPLSDSEFQNLYLGYIRLESPGIGTVNQFVAPVNWLRVLKKSNNGCIVLSFRSSCGSGKCDNVIQGLPLVQIKTRLGSRFIDLGFYAEGFLSYPPDNSFSQYIIPLRGDGLWRVDGKVVQGKAMKRFLASASQLRVTANFYNEENAGDISFAGVYGQQECKRMRGVADF